MAAWARGAAEGAALGASLAVAEIVVGYLSGGGFSARWWPVVLGCDAALGTLAGVVAWLVRVRHAFAVLAFAYAAVVVNHDVLPGRDRLSALPLAATALALGASVISARLVAKLTSPLALPFFLVGGLALGGFLIGEGGPGAVLAFLGLGFGCVVAGAWMVGRAGQLAPARRFGPALAAASMAVTAAAGAYGLTGPRAGGPDFRDLPQPAPGPGRGTRASVVLVVLDSVRADSVSAYGRSPAATPRLDALAREGTLFADVLTPAPWTVPAHASLFTGLAPSRHGVGVDAAGKWGALDPRALSLAEILAAEGYATAGISANRAVSASFGLDQGFRYFESLATRDHSFGYRPLVLRLEKRLPRWLLAEPLAERFPWTSRRAPEINARALAWLRRPRPAGQPFFLFVNYMEAHSPYLAEPGALGAAPEPRRAYGLALRTLDQHLGRLIDEIRAQPGGDEAWMVVTADHGESLGEHGLGHGCSFHHEVLHVPLVVRPPRSLALPRGGVDRHPLTLMDVLPLLLDGLGLATPPGLDGQRPGAERSFRVAESTLPSCGWSAREGARRAIQDARFKLIAGGGTIELYDRQADPAEAHDIAPTRPEETARLQAWLAEWVRRAEAARILPASPPDADHQDRLRALGYVR